MQANAVSGIAGRARLYSILKRIIKLLQIGFGFFIDFQLH